MLTEKGLRELLVSISCELSFRGDVREQNEEIQLEYEANGGKGSAFPPEDLIEIVRSRGSREVGHGGGAHGARDAEEEDFVEEDEYRIPPGEGDRYWNEYMVKNNSMRIRPAWACGCMRNSYDWSPWSDMVDLECIW